MGQRMRQVEHPSTGPQHEAELPLLTHCDVEPLVISWSAEKPNGHTFRLTVEFWS